MAAYGPVELEGLSIDIIRTLAAVSTAAAEAAEFGEAPAIVDPELDGHILGMISPKLLTGLTYEAPPAGNRGPRAWLRVRPDFGAPLKGDAVFALPSYVQQFF
jgi:hypothetical protein